MQLQATYYYRQRITTNNVLLQGCLLVFASRAVTDSEGQREGQAACAATSITDSGAFQFPLLI